GIVLLEAMASAKPIVASRIDGYEALVGPSGSGALVPPADVEALAGALITLLQDAVLRQTLGLRGLAAARAYDWSSIAAQLEQAYAEVLGSASPFQPDRRGPA